MALLVYYRKDVYYDASTMALLGILQERRIVKCQSTSILQERRVLRCQYNCTTSILQKRRVAQCQCNGTTSILQERRVAQCQCNSTTSILQERRVTQCQCNGTTSFDGTHIGENYQILHVGPHANKNGYKITGRLTHSDGRTWRSLT